jgi:hypothetical protein
MMLRRIPASQSKSMVQYTKLVGLNGQMVFVSDKFKWPVVHVFPGPLEQTETDE